ncbi:MAG: hypothetical protein AB7K24_08805 [Gemmataceae bacterium]
MKAEKLEALVSEGESRKAHNFIETYQIIAEWIRFADAKAAATLTVNGVLLGLLIPTLRPYLVDKSIEHPTAWWPALTVILFLIWMLLLVLSAINSFLCILPFRGPMRRLTLDQASHFHPAAVSHCYKLEEPERFVKDCEQAGPVGLEREVLTAILVDSHLSSAKYGYVTRSIVLLACSVGFGFLYLLAIQL